MIRVSNNLDGNPTHRGQRQGGNDEELEQNLARLEMERLLDERLRAQYSYYLKYVNLSTDELLTLDDELNYRYARMTTTERHLHNERYIQLANRLDKYDTQVAVDIQRKFDEKPRTHASHELGSREFTLTYSPKWMDDETARNTMKTAIQRLLKYYDGDILNLRAIGEVGTNGLSHIHCFYKLRKGLKITDKNFKRAYKYWNPKKKLGFSGHEGGHHANVKSESDFLGYIDKDIETAWYDNTVTEDPK